jgi:DNA ligase D-like protein (predicted 3'-phosphoesterase)
MYVRFSLIATLKEYQRKRDFSKTPEPPPRIEKKPSEDLRFVIQKHHARNLHYDLRLEREGVLKSWAIPKEPPRTAGIRRLAIETEDHPIGYEEFEGVIPEGEYGAGTVEIWDRGSYRRAEWEENSIVFEVNAKKLKGTFCLIKLKPKEHDDQSWLFFRKKEDATTKSTKGKNHEAHEG